MTVGDVYRVVVDQQYLGQEMLNVFYYQHTAGTGTDQAANLADIFQDNMLQEMSNLQLDTVEYDSISVVNGMRNTDQFVLASPTPAGGDLDSATLINSPSDLAVGFRSNRNGMGTRYSYKRFGGVPLSYVAGNGWSSLYDSALLSMAAELGTVLTQSGNSFTPVQITGGFKFGTAPTPTFFLTSWVFDTVPSSQATRRAGRGS